MDETLKGFDWLIIVIYLTGMLLIGYYFSRHNKDEKDFLLGGGNMNPLAVGISLFATLLSSLSFLSLPGEIIKYGPVMLTGMLAYPIVYFIVGWFIIPSIKKFEVTSAYEILEIKQGLLIRILATFFFLSLRILWMATIVYVTVDIVILSIFNISSGYSFFISFVLVIITILYTSMGGLKAVVFTDVIQSGVLIAGAILTLIFITHSFGSISEWFPNQWESHNWGQFKFGFDIHDRLTVSNTILMVFVWQIASAGSDQMSIQRFLATKDVHSARKTFGVSLGADFIAQVLLGLVGIALFSYFSNSPEYLSFGNSLSNQADILFPKFIVIGLPIGVSGLVIAGVLAAAMSSLSSGLNSCSSVIVEDVIKRFWTIKKPIRLKNIRMTSFLLGGLILLLSVGVKFVDGNLIDIIIKVVNLFVSPLFVLFVLSLYIPFCTKYGVFVGGISSLFVAVSIAYYKVFGIEVFYVLPFALISGIIMGIFFSSIELLLIKYIRK